MPNISRRCADRLAGPSLTPPAPPGKDPGDLPSGTFFEPPENTNTNNNVNQTTNTQQQQMCEPLHSAQCREHNILLSWNVQTASLGRNSHRLEDCGPTAKMSMILQECRRLGTPICVFQETRWCGTSSLGVVEDTTNQYRCYYSGHPIGSQHIHTGQHGVMIAVSTVEGEVSETYEIITLEGTNPARLMAFSGTVKDIPLAVINGYAPTNVPKQVPNSVEHYRELQHYIATVTAKHPRHHLIIAGDFNAVVGHNREDEETIWQDIRGSMHIAPTDLEHAEPNENGERLLELCTDEHLVITNTFFPPLDPASGSAHSHVRSTNGKGVLLDYILVSPHTDLWHNIVWCGVDPLNGIADTFSDHRPIRLSVTTTHTATTNTKPPHTRPKLSPKVLHNFRKLRPTRKQTSEQGEDPMETTPEGRYVQEYLSTALRDFDRMMDTTKAVQEAIRIAAETTGYDDPNPEGPQSTAAAQETINYKYKILTDGFKQALQCIEYTPKRTKGWFEAHSMQLQSLARDTKRAYSAYQDNPLNPTRQEEYRKAKCAYRTACRAARNSFFAEKTAAFLQFEASNNAKAFHDAVNRTFGPRRSIGTPGTQYTGTSERFMDPDKHGQLTTTPDEAQACKDRHYSRIFGSPPRTSKDAYLPPQQSPSPAAQSLERPYSAEEVLIAIRQMKNNKATGADEVHIEILKNISEFMLEWLTKFINEIYDLGVIPSHWSIAIIVSLWKGKGSKLDLNNFRPVSLLSQLRKMVERMILNRLTPYLLSVPDAIADTAYGSLPYRGTCDAQFISRKLSSSTDAQGIPLIKAYVDLTKAYDSVDRHLLYRILERHGVPNRMITLLKSLLDNSYAQVRQDDHLGAKIPLAMGLPQGSVLSGFCFVIFFSSLLQACRHDFKTAGFQGIKIKTSHGTLYDPRPPDNNGSSPIPDSHHYITDVSYVDDCFLVAHTEAHQQGMISIFEMHCTHYGLTISVHKTETITNLQACHESSEGGTTLHIYNQEVTAARVFKYLGSKENIAGNLKDETAARAQAMHGAFHKHLGRIYLNRHIPLGKRIHCYKTNVIEAGIFGAGAWNPRKSDFEALEKVQYQHLRRMIARTAPPGTGISYTSLLDRLSKQHIELLPLEIVIQQRILGYVGHILRLPSSRMEYKVLKGSVVAYTEPPPTQEDTQQRIRRLHHNIRTHEAAHRAALESFEWTPSAWLPLAQDKTRTGKMRYRHELTSRARNIAYPAWQHRRRQRSSTRGLPPSTHPTQDPTQQASRPTGDTTATPDPPTGPALNTPTNSQDFCEWPEERSNTPAEHPCPSPTQNADMDDSDSEPEQHEIACTIPQQVPPKPTTITPHHNIPVPPAGKFSPAGLSRRQRRQLRVTPREDITTILDPAPALPFSTSPDSAPRELGRALNNYNTQASPCQDDQYIVSEQQLDGRKRRLDSLTTLTCKQRRRLSTGRKTQTRNASPPS